ncbi:MAG TPA: class I adenylate-forming enzyme family protein [Vicinamibacteria bacterium]|nr:class I adenylate-forming enzyme family protein [Vicinamibacteria bacterium]
MTYEPSTLAAAFARMADQEPWAPLVVSSSRSTSRGEVAALARAAAEAVARSPATHLVGLSAPNGPAFLAGVLALRQGGHGVLLLDPAAPLAERRRACAALGARAMLSCTQGWPIDSAEWVSAGIPDAPTSEVSRDVGFVKLTSGSTGAPRGVAATEAALLADEDALGRTMGLRAEDRILGAIPMSHSYGFSSVALPALRRGSIAVVPDEEGPLAPLRAASFASATVFPSAPAYLQALLKLSQPPAWPSSVRLVISASAPLPPDVAAQFHARFGRRVHVFYGASECGGICYDREGTAAQMGTVGEPVEGVRVRLEPLDGDAEEGLVTVESPAVALGYLPSGDERLGRGRFLSSDLGVFEGRALRLRGRVDGLINVKGKKVNPTEIECVLQRMPGVSEVVAFGVPSADKASDTVRAVIACPTGALGYDEVLAWCRAHLPEHKVPRSVVLVSAIPRTSRGKVSREELMALVGGRTADPRG